MRSAIKSISPTDPLIVGWSVSELVSPESRRRAQLLIKEEGFSSIVAYDQ